MSSLGRPAGHQPLTYLFSSVTVTDQGLPGKGIDLGFKDDS